MDEPFLVQAPQTAALRSSPSQVHEPVEPDDDEDKVQHQPTLAICLSYEHEEDSDKATEHGLHQIEGEYGEDWVSPTNQSTTATSLNLAMEAHSDEAQSDEQHDEGEELHDEERSSERTLCRNTWSICRSSCTRLWEQQVYEGVHALFRRCSSRPRREVAARCPEDLRGEPGLGGGGRPAQCSSCSAMLGPGVTSTAPLRTCAASSSCISSGNLSDEAAQAVARAQAAAKSAEAAAAAASDAAAQAAEAAAVLRGIIGGSCGAEDIGSSRSDVRGEVKSSSPLVA